MRVITALLASLVAVAAVPTSQRIIGGSPTTIDQYPSIVALLYASNANVFLHHCGGTLLNNRSIMTSATCTYGDPTSRWRVRTGSSFANSDGNTYGFSAFIYHPNFNSRSMDSDIVILRTSANIPFSNVVQPGSIAGANYNLGDNEVVWAAGFGWTGDQTSEHPDQLRHVQILSVNQGICRRRHAIGGLMIITDNMLCSGFLDGGGRGICFGDFGGPLYHHNVVVGISSFRIHGCAHRLFPDVNTRVSRFTQWIIDNA
nr:trypsin, alkaline B-like [Helicoverpa armigera]